MESMRGYWGLGLLLAFMGCGLLIRALLIQTGRYKAPLLREFERYRDAPFRYNVLRDLAAYTGATWGGIILVLAHLTPLPTPWLLPMALLWGAALLAHWLGADLEPIMPMPRWFARFLRMTSASERRRIAYAWLNITPAMRKHFNAQDDDFFAWVDLVMLTVV